MKEGLAEQRLQSFCVIDLLPSCLQDSTYKYYEIIMVDIAHKVIRQVRLLAHLLSQRPISRSPLSMSLTACPPGTALRCYD